ncbi:TOMM precursor leader peptide-binding protein [Kitasatospora terrestris]|uniref:YcaO domain-containing protein n=1 Tax=Kitasatospora terrestris TaxID=258051 RepID=A0ABP9DFF8_9ACTN
MTTALRPAPLLGPGLPASWPWQRWADALGPGILLAARSGHDADWERAALDRARAEDRALLSLRLTAQEILIGPLWTPSTDRGCAGCAERADRARRLEPEQRFVRQRADRETSPHRPAAATREARALPPWLAATVETLLANLAARDAEPGTATAVTADGRTSRHRVARDHGCTVCGDPPPALLADTAPPPARPTAPRPTPARLPLRGPVAPFDLDPARMRASLADPRFGPITRTTRHAAGTYPITETELLAGTPAGMGRAGSFREAEAISVLEAYERTAGYPHHTPLLPGRTYRELGGPALDPATLGHHTEAQLASPHSRLRRWTPDTRLDWVWSHPLDGGAPRLVPAEIGFFRYRYDLRPYGEGSDAGRNCFLESSSGSALGSGYEEAALHALLELAERDAFLLAWHRARPLPALDPAAIRDPASRMMLRLADEHGYDVHLLVITDQLALPTVWALAVNRRRALPASFSTAGCHPDPEQAVRAALWELTQMVSGGLAWDPDEYQHTVDDPWSIQTIAEHWRRYTFPELLPRVERVLGGPTTTPAEAFPDWPHALVRAARGDVRGALDHVAGLYDAAGLRQILIVDQSTPEQTAHGMTAVKAVVPGIVPMCFGHAQQRLAGLPRLLDTLDADERDLPFDPHPFP